MRKTYPRYTKPCATCGYIMKDACAPDCEENGGGWWWCTPCDKEILPVWYGFQMYDTVEITGMIEDPGRTVRGSVKGGKNGTVGVSTDGFYGFFKPGRLKLCRRVRPIEE